MLVAVERESHQQPLKLRVPSRAKHHPRAPCGDHSPGSVQGSVAANTGTSQVSSGKRVPPGAQTFAELCLLILSGWQLTFKSSQERAVNASLRKFGPASLNSSGKQFRRLSLWSSRCSNCTQIRPEDDAGPTTYPLPPCRTTTLPRTRRSRAATTVSPQTKPPTSEVVTLRACDFQKPVTLERPQTARTLSCSQLQRKLKHIAQLHMSGPDVEISEGQM